MKRVYVVTDGEYSDYHIEKVFTNPYTARIYQMLKCPEDGEVEAYDVDDVTVCTDSRWFRVRYNVKYGNIDCIDLVKGESKNTVKYEYGNAWYSFTINASNNRLYDNIIKYGMQSKMLLKICTDRLAEYLYEHGINREKLLEKAQKKFEKKNPNWYKFERYTTSLYTSQPNPENIRVNEQLHELIKNGQKLPEDLTDLFNTAKEENNG